MAQSNRPLSPGERAPDFTLKDQRGGDVRLQDMLGERAVVLYFYPGDNTPVCTRESCAFRDAYEAFTDAGAEVVGVSRDGVDSHAGFAGRHSLPFTLLSDPDGAIHERYGARMLGGLMPRRITYVIDREGVVRHAFSSQLRAGKHVSEALEVVRSIQGAKG